VGRQAARLLARSFGRQLNILDIYPLFFISVSAHIFIASLRFFGYGFAMPSQKPKILLILDHDMLRRIEDYRRSQEKIPTRNEAIRRLIDDSLMRFARLEEEND